MPSELRDFLALAHEAREQLNLEAKEQRQRQAATHEIQEERLMYLTDEKRVKTVSVLYSDLEGPLQMLDYDKKFLSRNWDNLTFDGSLGNSRSPADLSRRSDTFIGKSALM